MKNVTLRVFSLLCATAAAVVAWVLVAAVRPDFVVLAGAALAAFLSSGFLLLRVVDPGTDQTIRRRRLVWLLAGAAVYMSVAQFTVGHQPPRTLDDPVASPNVKYWTLPDGGRLAYLHTPAKGKRRDTPVVMLHGGPGIPALPVIEAKGVRPLDFLAADGFAVYYYDQRGAGFSSRVDLRREDAYSVAGHVADLEAVRAALGAERMVLVGHGWGATLAANYALAHPEHVARLVVIAPAPLWYPAFEEMVTPDARATLTEVQASTLALLEQPPFRLVIGRLTATTSRKAAHTMVEDYEVDQWWTRSLEAEGRLAQPNLVCNSDPARLLPPVLGVGYFAHSYTLADALQLPDPRPALEKLQVPVLIVRGICDYIRWEVAHEYLTTLPGAKYVAVPAGGYLLWVEQQSLLETVVGAFLRGEEVPLAFHHPRD